jgi:predicted nucleotidyltransferase
MTDQTDPGVVVPIPFGERRVFRNQAMEDVLELLYRNPHEEFGVRQLREITDHGAGTVDTALTLLTQLDLVRDRREGNRRLVRIARDRVRKPDDPLLEIPQDQFRDPVGAFRDEVRGRLGDDLVGILLFGSVARGEADRTSDVDVQVIVEAELLQSRRTIHDVRHEIESRRFDGDRYELQVLVESVETVEQHGDRLREIFAEGVTLHGSDRLADLRGVVLGE